MLVAGVAAAAAVAHRVHELGRVPPALVAAMPTLVCLAAGVLGIWQICAGWPRRVGPSLHCSRCGYERDEHGPVIWTCPECGGPWRWLGWFKTGRTEGSPRAVGLGVALCILAWAAALAG